MEYTESVTPSTQHQETSAPRGAATVFRKLFFIVLIVVFLLALLFLVYQNGKSIYANGI